MGHARLSPSGSERWMTCSGSVAMEEGEPASTSEYSDEGTAGHALAAVCLKEGGHPAAYLGRILEVVNGVCLLGHGGPRPPMLFGHTEDSMRTFEVDADFAGAVNAYVQRVKEYASAPGAVMHVEVPLPIDHITEEEGATGTGDTIIVIPDEELQAHDLKFGMGVKVHAENNPQAMHYLSGARRRFPGNYKRFRIVIHQPRLGHLSEWDCTAAELDAFEKHAHVRASLAMMAMQTKGDWMHLTGGSHALVPSEGACKFCRAKAKCPALGEFVSQTVGEDFPVLASADPTAPGVPSFIPTDLPTLGIKLRAVDLIEDWCKAIRAKVEGALFEHGNNADAIATLGMKLVQGRKGARAWGENEGAAEAAMKKMRLKMDEMYSFKVITPTAAEKFFEEQPKRWKTLEPLIKQSPGRPSVALADDKRPALVLTPLADAFPVSVEGSDLV